MTDQLFRPLCMLTILIWKSNPGRRKNKKKQKKTIEKQGQVNSGDIFLFNKTKTEQLKKV